MNGELADDGWRIVDAVAQTIASRLPGQAVGLLDGAAGVALFYAYLAATREDPAAAHTAHKLLGQAIHAVAKTRMRPTLCDGFSGIGWMVRHVERSVLRLPGPERHSTEELDDALLLWLSRPRGPCRYELLQGLAGIAVYALEAAEPKPRKILLKIVDHLHDTAIHQSPGITWFTAPHQLAESQRQLTPHGLFNLGMAHGVPALLPVLSAIYRLGLARETVRPLLEGAVRWLLAQRLGQDSPSCFAGWVADGKFGPPARLAWCYGDLGIVMALLEAARAWGEAAWWDAALDIAHRAAQRPEEDTRIEDRSLCHGFAGAAHCFHRIYRATGETVFADAARFWFARLLEDSRGWDLETTDRRELGFLTGAAGAALALLAALTDRADRADGVDREPAWDRPLLCSTAPTTDGV